MATITTTDIKFSKNGIKAKTKASTINKSVNIILDSLQEQHPKHYIAWADFMEQLELHFEMPRVEAAACVRQLINSRKLHQVPCHLTASIAFTKEASLLKSSVYTSDEDEKQITELDQKYLKQLENTVREQRQRAATRRYEKDRKELLSKE